MGIAARVPRAAAERKPPHGAPCNRCGVCCMATLCELGRFTTGREIGPCPWLMRSSDDGRYVCGHMHANSARAREAAGWLIGTGTGCDCRINGEPADQGFCLVLEKWDHDHAAEVRRARDVWGLP